MNDVLSTLSPEQVRALGLLARSPGGCPEGVLAAHGISIDDMVALVRSGLATARGERVRAGDQVTEVATLTITPEGRKAIGERWRLIDPGLSRR
jgi:hypothetical protein